MIPLRWVGRGRSQEKVSSLEVGPSFPGVIPKFCGSPVGAELGGGGGGGGNRAEINHFNLLNSVKYASFYM